MPFLPQVEAASCAHSASGSVPAVIPRQRPSAAPVFALEQATQRVPQADSQQTPSTQKLLEHWLAATQDAPFACGVTQCPAVLQNVPFVQSVSPPQVVLQLVLPQM
jgi:hypothetical protein